jgi:hypothetical protein
MTDSTSLGAGGEELHGLLAEFGSEQELVSAARRVREAGYSKTDAYTPYPCEEVIHALGVKRSKVPLIVLIGGILGALVGYGLQYWVSAIAYPLNVGGRPYNSWVSFIVVTFELTILFASISGVVGMIALNKLPQPYHPVFNVPEFKHASRDGFFLLIEAADEQFDREGTQRFLHGLDAVRVREVES